MYSSEQYSVHRFSICRSCVRHFPERSCTVVTFPFSQWSRLLPVGVPSYCCSSSDFLQSHHTVLYPVFFSFFHVPLDVVVHFLVFLSSFRLETFFLECLLKSYNNNSLANGLYRTRLLLNCHTMWPRAATQNMCLSLMVLNYECGVFDCV